LRPLALALLASTLLAAPPAIACGHDDCPGSLDIGSGIETPARWAPRVDSRSAVYGITSRDGKIELLLTPSVVAFQLSDEKMSAIERKLRDEQNEGEDNPLGSAIKTAVFAGVRVLLKHGAVCPVRELRDVDYRDGELVFVTRSGDRVFDRVEVDDRDLLASFPEREARAFVREFRRLKAGGR